MIVDALAAPLRDDPDVALASGILQNDSYGPADHGVILPTEDGGASWTTVSEDVFWGFDLEFCPGDSQRVIAAARRSQLAVAARSLRPTAAGPGGRPSRRWPTRTSSTSRSRPAAATACGRRVIAKASSPRG